MLQRQIEKTSQNQQRITLKRGLQSFKRQNKEVLGIVKQGYQKIVNQVIRTPLHNSSSPIKANFEQAFSQLQPKADKNMLKKKAKLIRLNHVSDSSLKKQNSEGKSNLFGKPSKNNRKNAKKLHHNYCVPLLEAEPQQNDKNLTDTIQRLRIIKQRNHKIEKKTKQQQIARNEKIKKTQYTEFQQSTNSTKQFRYSLTKTSTRLLIPRVQRIQRVQNDQQKRRIQMRLISQFFDTHKQKNNRNSHSTICRSRNLSSVGKLTQKKISQHELKLSGCDFLKSSVTFKQDSQPTFKSLLSAFIVQKEFKKSREWRKSVDESLINCTLNNKLDIINLKEKKKQDKNIDKKYKNVSFKTTVKIL